MQTYESSNCCTNTTCCEVDFICLPSSKFKRIVVIGGGFAGLELVKGLRNKEVQVVLIDKNNFHQFQPLLYQVATSGLEPDSIVFPLRKQLVGYTNVTFRLANVLNINTSNNTIYTDKGKLIFDYLVIATGTSTNFFGMKPLKENSLGLKSIKDSLNIRHLMLQNLEKAAITCDIEDKDALTNFVIVGGGPAGIEMAGSLAEFKKHILPKDYPEFPNSIMNIYLIEATNEILSGMSYKASDKALNYLKELKIEVLLNETVSNYDGNVVSTKSGKKIFAKNLIWTAGVKGVFPKGIDLKSVVNGNRIKINEHLKVAGYQNIFAIGDTAAILTKEWPKGHPQVAQTAIQQGKHLAEIILNSIKNKQLSSFKYKDKGTLATVGKKKAVADIGKLKLTGYAAWLIWSFVHLMSISGFRNKLLVGLNWAISYFSYEKSNRIIIRNFNLKRNTNDE